MSKPQHFHLQNGDNGPDRVAQLSGASSCTLKGGRFDFWSGYTPRLRVQSQVVAHAGGNQSTFLSHIGIILSLPLSKISLKEKISVS